MKFTARTSPESHVSSAFQRCIALSWRLPQKSMVFLETCVLRQPVNTKLLAVLHNASKDCRIFVSIEYVLYSCINFRRQRARSCQKCINVFFELVDGSCPDNWAGHEWTVPYKSKCKLNWWQTMFLAKLDVCFSCFLKYRNATRLRFFFYCQILTSKKKKKRRSQVNLKRSPKVMKKMTNETLKEKSIRFLQCSGNLHSLVIWSPYKN